MIQLLSLPARLLWTAAFLALFVTSAIAQTAQPVLTVPAPAGASFNASGTIASTNTFQSVFSATTTSQPRKSCLIQNLGSHTMFVFFGPIASATTSNSASLAQNSVPISCNIGGMALQDQVSITGTSGDAFFAIQQ